MTIDGRWTDAWHKLSIGVGAELNACEFSWSACLLRLTAVVPCRVWMPSHQVSRPASHGEQQAAALRGKEERRRVSNKEDGSVLAQHMQ
jgi:hypothetical protein